MASNFFAKPSAVPSRVQHLQLVKNPPPPPSSTHSSHPPPPTPLNKQFLGAGSCGIVEKVLNGGGFAVARKTFKISGRDSQEAKNCLWEFHILRMARDLKALNLLWAAPPSGPEQPIIQLEKGLAFFDVELADWGNLYEFLHNTPRLYIGEQLVKSVGIQTIRGLCWLHERRFLHGDLKPGNLLVFKGPFEPHIKIGDFGSCTKMADNGKDSRRQIDKCITTYEYAAPEMLSAGPQSKVVSLQADIYSLGVLLMEMTGQQHPFHCMKPAKERDPKWLYNNRPRQFEVYKPRFRMPDDLKHIFNRMTAFVPELRPTIAVLRRESVFNDVRVGYKMEYLTSPQEVRKQKADLERELKATQERLMNCERSLKKIQETQSLARSIATSPTLPKIVNEMDLTPTKTETVSVFPILLTPTHLLHTHIRQFPQLFYRLIHSSQYIEIPAPNQPVEQMPTPIQPPEQSPTPFEPQEQRPTPIQPPQQSPTPFEPPEQRPTPIQPPVQIPIPNPTPEQQDIKLVVLLEDDEQENIEPPAKRPRFELQGRLDPWLAPVQQRAQPIRARVEVQEVVDPGLAEYEPAPAQRRDQPIRAEQWVTIDYQVPGDAQQVFERSLFPNGIRRMEPNTSHALFTLALDTRILYSLYYRKGQGLSIAKDYFLSLINDPMGLLPQLESIPESEFSDLETGFLLASRAICQSNIAPGTLGFILFKNRQRKKFGKKMKNLL